MKKYAKVIQEETGLCEVGLGTNEAFYRHIGMTEQEVEQGYDGKWYVKGHAPVPPEPTVQERLQELERETGLTRALRELVLATGSGASDYVREQAADIETLAQELRGGDHA